MAIVGVKDAEAIAHMEAAGIPCGYRDVAALPSFEEVAVLCLRVVVAVVEEAVGKHAALVLPALGTGLALLPGIIRCLCGIG